MVVMIRLGDYRRDNSRLIYMKNDKEGTKSHVSVSD